MKEDDIHPAIETLRRATKRCNKAQSGIAAPHNGRDPFRVLITAILSLHIKDPIVAAGAAERLLALANTPQAMIRLSPQEILEAISSISFFRAKVHHILQVSRILVDRYNGRIPDNRDALIALPGIGPKTAALVVVQAFDQPAICVDMSVHRIVNRWGYVTTKSPAKTEAALLAKLPRDYWLEISEEMDALGNSICLPTLPKCATCPVNAYCDRVGVTRSR